MAESSWPTTAGSRVVDDAQYEHLAWGWARADGILGNPGDTSVCFGDSSGRQVKMRLGKRGFVRGRGWYSGTSDNILAIAANASGSTRKDVIVLRLTRSTWAVTAAVVQGTPGAGNPSLTQNATGGTTGVWEIPVAVVTVANGAATIATGDVEQCVWYSHGDRIVTLSTAPIQPSAAEYTNMLHSDTGKQWETVSGAWRRAGWSQAWGIIGGKRYNNNTQVQSGITGTEALALMDSGVVSLEANRRYELICRIAISATTNDTYFAFRLRESSLAGTAVSYWEQIVRGAGSFHMFEFTNEITNSTATTKTYVATLQRLGGGNMAVLTGTSAFPAGVWVKDVGPSTPNVVTIVP